jgi:hypothetical protein
MSLDTFHTPHNQTPIPRSYLHNLGCIQIIEACTDNDDLDYGSFNLVETLDFEINGSRLVLRFAMEMVAMLTPSHFFKKKVLNIFGSTSPNTVALKMHPFRIKHGLFLTINSAITPII